MSIATMKRKTNAKINISRGGNFMLNNKKSSLSTKAYISTRLVNPSSCSVGGCPPKEKSFNIGEKSQSSYILDKAYNCGNNHDNIKGNAPNCDDTCYDKNIHGIVKSIITTGSISSSQHTRNVIGKCSD
jgi:hypothetical protein